MDQLMDILLSIGALFFVFIAIGFCIFSHELGHFLAAKWRGMHIDAFSLGFRPFWKKKINGVEYRLGWLPFGGYVELPQVDATDAVPKAADGTELPRAKAIDRIITAVAGPLFNILSGLLIACFVWWIGMPQDSPKMREITVLSVDPAGPEYAAGLRPEDKIVKINGEPFFSTWAQFVSKILFSIGKVDLEVIRDGKPITISYTPVDNPNAPGRLRSEKIAWPFFQPLIPLELVPEKGSPAEKAGIKAGDYVVAIDGMPIIDFDEFLFGINLAGNNPIRMTLRRGDQTVEVTVRPEPITPSPGPEFSRYMTGIYMQPAGAEGGDHLLVPCHVGHVVAFQEVIHDGAARVLRDILAKDCGAPVGQGSERVLEENEGYHKHARGKGKVARVRKQIPKEGEPPVDELHLGMVQYVLRRGNAHGHEGNGEDGGHLHQG